MATAKETKQIETLKNRLDLVNVKYEADATLETLVALTSAFQDKEEITSAGMDTIKGLDSLQTIEEPIRVKIVCNNPEKRAHKGEYFGVGNSFGTIKAFVPYNCSTADDMFVPRGLIEVIKMREYLHIRELTERERRESGGSVMHITSWSKEFTVIELDMGK